MNIRIFRRNRRKSANVLRTASEACETRSLLCAAALPVGELVADPTVETEATLATETVDEAVNVELVTCEMLPGDGTELEAGLDTDWAAVCGVAEGTEEITGETVEIPQVSEEELLKWASEFMASISYEGEDGTIAVDEEAFQEAVRYFMVGTELLEGEEIIPEIAICNFLPPEGEETIAEEWDPSFAYRGGEGESPFDGEILVQGFIDEDGDGLPDDPFYTCDLPIIEQLPPEIPVEQGLDLDGDGIDDINMPIKAYFGVMNEGEVVVVEDGGEVLETPVTLDGDPEVIYYFGIPVDGEQLEEVNEVIDVTVVDENEAVREEPVEGEVLVVEVTTEEEVEVTLFEEVPVEADGVFIRTLSAGLPDGAFLRNLSAPEPTPSLASESIGSSAVQTTSGAAPVSLVANVNIPQLPERTTVFTGNTTGQSSTQVSPESEEATAVTETPLQSTPQSSRSRLRSSFLLRSIRSSSGSEVGVLESPFAEEANSEESTETVVEQPVQEELPIEEQAQAEATPVRPADRKSIDMFMSEYAEDSFLS